MPRVKYIVESKVSKRIYYTLASWLILVMSHADARSICNRDESFDKCLFQYRLSNENPYQQEEGFVNSGPIDVVLHGSLHEYAYYYTIVEIGTPPQKQAVVIDTGSPNLVVTSSLCTHCGEHEMKPLDPNMSQTLSYISWRNPLCFMIGGIRGKGGICNFEQMYAEESSVKGKYVRDFFMFANETSPNVMFILESIGCITGETRLIYKQKANGVLGLGLMEANPAESPSGAITDGTKVSDRNVLECNQQGDNVTNQTRGHQSEHNSECAYNISKQVQKGCINPQGKTNFIDDYLIWHFPSEKHIFSICFSENGGMLTLGGYHKKQAVKVNRTKKRNGCRRVKDPITWVPLMTTSGYSIQIESIVFSGHKLKTNNNVFVLDSGTTNTLLESPIHGHFLLFYTKLCNMIQDNGQHTFIEDYGNTDNDHSEECPKQKHTNAENASSKHLHAVNKISKAENNHKGRGKSNSYGKMIDKEKEGCTGVCTDDTVNYRKYDDSIYKLYAKLHPSTRCIIQQKTGYLCFSDISQMPAVHLRLKSTGNIIWYPQSYFIHRTSGSSDKSTSGWWCLGIDNGIDENVLGATFFKQNLLIFDLHRSRLGYARARCPKYMY